jgi:DNA adenine methylase
MGTAHPSRVIGAEPAQLVLEGLASSRAVPPAAPFLKWAGGKRRLLGQIARLAPARYERYLEPFLGGGAVALALARDPMLLNDANHELIEAYEVVRDDVEGLCDLLDELQARHCAEEFYRVRSLCPDRMGRTEQAARFIYLNKTAYNGLYRVNRSGRFNVPLGRYRDPVLYDRRNLLAVSQVIRRALLSADDYADFLARNVRAGDFVYLDPPYHPVGRYSDFKRYTRHQFREQDQRRLAEAFDDIIARGAHPVLSNSNCAFTRALYARHRIMVVEAPRAISSDGSGRQPITEILVTPR